MPYRRLPCCLLMLALVLPGLCLGQPAERPRHWPLVLGNRTFAQMELALTEQERQNGLMFRTSLPQDGGMLFVFDHEQVMAFWMKNTKIPLDILYLDGRGKIVAMHTMNIEPPQLPGEARQLYESRLATYSSEKPAQFAIEINAGKAAKCGLQVGQTIQLNSTELRRLAR